MDVASDSKDGVRVERAALLRTTRKLMSGEAFVSRAIWAGS
jgi:2-methylaconitate cis-trans-isomerase PrpF